MWVKSPQRSRDSRLVRLIVFLIDFLASAPFFDIGSPAWKAADGNNHVLFFPLRHQRHRIRVRQAIKFLDINPFRTTTSGVPFPNFIGVRECPIRRRQVLRSRHLMQDVIVAKSFFCGQNVGYFLFHKKPTTPVDGNCSQMEEVVVENSDDMATGGIDWFHR